MADTAAEKPQGGPSWAGALGVAMRSSDVALAIGVMCIILMLILPMPSWLLDFALTISITFSVVILMTSLFIERPLQLSSFPTILLIATMMRLGLNLASTRLILANGHEGTQAAGAVIEAFGTFLMGGEAIIGITVFAILIIVNFVVITKGSGRIAEVAARFSLDAMPGKQMAIDADLSAGLISEDDARNRRRALEDESAFFGAMDGASKFVRGDAIAGLLITFVNIVVGIIVGVAMKGMDFGSAFSTYTVLTVGDGLVSQIPALIVSTAAGLLVTKAGVAGKTDKALMDQLSNYPRALWVSSGLVGFIGLMPGLPMIPFVTLASALGGAAFYLQREQAERDQKEQHDQAAKQAEQAAPVEEPISASLAMDPIRLELGYSLLALVNEDSGYRLPDQIKALRRELAKELGFVLPSVRILDNFQLGTTEYRIMIRETQVARAEVRPNMLLVMDPDGKPVELPGEETLEPAFGLPATWVDNSQRQEASFRGYTVVEPPTVITTHLTEVIKDNMPDLLSYAATTKLLDDLPPENKKLVEDMIPGQVSVSALQRVLQNLLAERVSIRDLPTILEGLAEATAYTQNIVMMSEHVRARLGRQICADNADKSGAIPLVTLTPLWEQRFAESLHGQGDERQLAMPPSQLQEFIEAVKRAFEQQARLGVLPCLLTSPGIRPYVRSIIERFRPQTVVLSQNEIHPKAKLRPLGQI
ncbi:MAG: flagellar biosynthesis protein FlhA [Sphingomonadales bacterium]